MAKTGREAEVITASPAPKKAHEIPTRLHDRSELVADDGGHAQRRGRNMLMFAAGLRGTAELCGNLSDQQVADVIWSMNAAEYWVLLVHERSWSPDQFAVWLTDVWSRLLLAETVPD